MYMWIGSQNLYIHIIYIARFLEGKKFDGDFEICFFMSLIYFFNVVQVAGSSFCSGSVTFIVQPPTIQLQSVCSLGYNITVCLFLGP